eukprot:354704-Chlamydomonas_euryale.AAC.5
MLATMADVRSKGPTSITTRRRMDDARRKQILHARRIPLVTSATQQAARRPPCGMRQSHEGAARMRRRA